MKSMINILKVADYLTLANVCSGILSILLSIKGMFFYAALLLVLAAVFDYFDGKVARLLKQENSFGKELDSLSDVVSFGVAPAIFGFSYVGTFDILLSVSILFFVVCAVLRLARYNVKEFTGYFIGVPVTLNAFIIPIFFILSIPSFYWSIMYLIVGYFMVSSIKIKKPFR